jgi:tRNA(Ile)-lysidine synthase
MIRGSGLKGLSGMAHKRDRIIRPLLSESKSSLLSYLAEHRIWPLHDSSNDDRSFLRNRIRLDLLPELEKQYNPAIRTNILQTCAILQQEEDLLESLADALFGGICTVTPDGKGDSGPLSIALSRQGFAGAHPALQRRVLEKICWTMRSRPSFRIIITLQQLIGDGVTGTRQHLPDGLRVRLTAENVIFSHPAGRQKLRGNGETAVSIDQTIAAAGSYAFPEIARQLIIQRVPPDSMGTASADTLIVDGDTVSFPLVVRSVRPGERMKPLGAPGRKKVSRIFNDLKIPADLRHRYPVLTADSEIVAILGLKIADYCKYRTESATLLALTWKNIDLT